MLNKNPTLSEQIAEDIAFSEECRQWQTSQTIVEAENERLKAINAELWEIAEKFPYRCDYGSDLAHYEAIMVWWCTKMAPVHTLRRRKENDEIYRGY